MLGRVADRCEKLGAAIGPNGIPGVSIRALMARPGSAVSAADLVQQPPGPAAHTEPRTPLEALTVQILRVAASAEPADRKDRELRQLAARIAALPPQGTGIIDPDPDPPARLSPASARFWPPPPRSSLRRSPRSPRTSRCRVRPSQLHCADWSAGAWPSPGRRFREPVPVLTLSPRRDSAPFGDQA
jgi:hypothetical protein